MSTVELVPFDQGRAVITGLQLPVPPPTRISVSGHTYGILAPRSVLPPLINTVKVIMNYRGPNSRIARNIFYLLKGAGSGSTSDPVWLKAVAEMVKIQWQNSNMHVQMGNVWFLTGVTAKDNGGTSAQATTSTAEFQGNASGPTYPPQCAVCVSWKIAEVYRGGKPRTYLPGVPQAATTIVGDPTLILTYATAVDTAATAWMAAINSTPVSSTAVTMGTISHYTGHAVRPTPLFRAYFDVKVHQRLDSQRRRNGPESLYGVTP